MGVVVVEGDRVGYEVMRDGDGREEEREWERDRLFRVVRKSRCVSGSLDRLRPIPAPTTSLLSLSLPVRLLLSSHHHTLFSTPRIYNLDRFPRVFISSFLSKWVPFRKLTPMSLKRPSPSSS